MMTSEIAPEAYAPLKRAADQGRVKLLDLGVSRNADGLWFNLKPGALGRRSARGVAAARRAAPRDLDGGRSQAVRRHGVPRRRRAGLRTGDAGQQALVLARRCRRRRTIRPRAKQLLASIGLTDRNGDGMLEDAQNRPARFTLLTQKGRPNLERGAAVIRDELKKIGLDRRRRGARRRRGDRSVPATRSTRRSTSTPTRPTSIPAPTPTSGSAPAARTCGTSSRRRRRPTWERRIDELMARQIASPDEAERKRLYDEVQKIFSEHLPIVYFAAPRIYVAHSARVTNLTPVRVPPAAALAARHGGRRPLIRYLARRLAFALFLVVAVSSASLVLARLAPGDFVTESLGTAAPAARRSSSERARYGLDKSIGAQYRDWLAAAVRLDFGRLDAVRPAGPRPDSRARREHRDPRGHRARLRDADRPAARRRHRQPPRRRAARRDPRRVARAAVDAAAADLAVPGLRRRAHRLAADCRHALGDGAGGRRVRSICCATSSCRPRRSALPLAAMLERLQAQAMSEVIGEPFVLATLARGVPRSRDRLARRAEGGAAAGRRGLRPDHRHAAQRIVRGRSDHRVAGPRQPDAAGAARARRLSGRRLRRRRRAVPRRRHAGVGPRARAGRSARERDDGAERA